MKPQVLHRVSSQNYFIKLIDMGSIQSLQVQVMEQNPKTTKRYAT